MTSFCLTIKAWQLVGLIFGLPMLLQALLIGTVTVLEPTPTILFLVPLIVLLSLGGFLGWFWSVGIALNQIVEADLRLDSQFFRMGMLYMVAYLGFFFLFPLLISVGFLPPGFFFLMVPLHLLAMGCMVYALYFVAKNLALAERQQPVRFSDYLGPLLLLWFLPLGIWFIQPRVNKLFAETTPDI